MSGTFSQVAILGGGLLGGSLALTLLRQEPPPGVRLWVRRAETVREAQAAGIAGATCDLGEAVAGAELVVLAVPVGAMAALVSAARDAGLADGCLITDVGSVKSAPHRSIAPLLEGTGAFFIGSHPMAGSEKNGIHAIEADLFQDAACLLTNDDRAPEELAWRLERFWQQAGCRTFWTDAAAHDALVAKISHLPHVLAAAGARVGLKEPADGRFGGGGMRDTTRVASGNPEMWAEILTENRVALLAPLRETIEDLREILASLEIADQEHTRRWLATAKQRRDALPERKGPFAD